ncbi:MAG: serine protease [Deltaproteobacteria bacterium CG_4_8_14_3_um_filter_45_9]|nr:MAG: serine protease [Deltaproteobacteria bacterium CG03_land_8_20_14_0_80_45_14]PIX25826.1 MAG: serine protease [Deltaproteobacteria bacterium CG_4_8_14_3_um_filter_45_9]
MKRYKVLIFFFVLFLFPFVFGIPGQTQDKAPIFTIEVDGIINPATAKFITDSIDQAAQQGGQCLIIQLDTPGGLMDSMRLIVKKILASHIPIIVYVAPKGARAASAGVFITMAAHIAVMAPGTHIGAAHPVTLGAEGKESKTMTEKVVNDAVADIKATTKTRGRNVDWAEKAVRKSVSITEEEALKLNVVDLISSDLQDLLTKIDGRVVKFDGTTRTLLTKGQQPRSIQMSWRERLLDVISNPTIAYIFLMLGIYGIFFELSSPGAILPGVVGGIFLILAFYALQMLPVNYAGLALILFGIILFIAEIKVVSHGVLAIGGVISLLLGSMMLFQSPVEYMRVSLSVIIPAVMVSAAFFIFAVTKAIDARLKKPTTGMEGLIGEEGVATASISPEGKISIHGEFWNAISDQSIERGEKVQVIGVTNLKLKVKKIE